MDDLTKPDLLAANRSAYRPTSTACSEVYIRHGMVEVEIKMCKSLHCTNLLVTTILRQEIVSTYSFASYEYLPVRSRCKFASYISDCYTINMAVSTSTASIGRTKG